jgi:uncharacterized protein (TIGR03437 family)
MSNVPTRLLAAALAALPLATSAAGQAVYVGGAKQVQAVRVASDSAGNRYVAGTVFFNSGYELAGVDADIFLTKIAPDGNVVYTLYFGGDGSDELRGMAVDQAGRVYLAGATNSANFPAVNALQPRLGGGQDGFLCRLTPSGGFDYSTFLGGSRSDSASAVAVDASGNAYVTGETASIDFPVTRGAFQTTTQPPDVFRSPSDAFVTKVSSDGRSLLYSTYLGGRNVVCIGGSRCIPAASREAGLAIAVDAAGSALVAGRTNSSDFPVTAGAFQTACQCDYFSSDIFVARLDAAGSALVFSTYLGGRGPGIVLLEESLGAMALDREGHVLLTGAAWSLGSGASGVPFPTTPGAFQPRLDYTGRVPFVTKLDRGGGRLLFSTFLSGKGTGAGVGIAVDDAGTVCVTGTTSAADFPLRPGAVSRGGSFYAQLDRTGSTLLFSTLLPNGFAGADLAYGPSGRAHLLGPAGYLSQIETAAPALPPLLGVANAAAATVTGRIVAGELVSLFGTSIGPDSPQGLRLDPDGTVATELGGVDVRFNSRPAPLTYAQLDQINAVVPMLVGFGEVLVEVRRAGRVTASLRLSPALADPQIFPNGSYAAALNEDGTVNGPGSPARVGSVVAVFATGLGWLNPLPADGQTVFAELPRAALPVRVVTGDGRHLPVLWAGQAPGLVAGVAQVNFRLELSEAILPHTLSIRLVVGGVAGNEARLAVAP